MGELRNPLGMIDSVKQEQEEKAFYKNFTQEYLLLLTTKDEERKFFIVNGRVDFIEMLQGLLNAGDVDIDESYVLTDSINVKLSDRVSVRDFVRYINGDDSIPEDAKFELNEDFEEDYEDQEEE